MDYLDLIVDGAPGLQVPIKLTSMNFEALMVRQPMGGPAARLPPPHTCTFTGHRGALLL